MLFEMPARRFWVLLNVTFGIHLWELL